jgi:Tubulin like
MNANEVSPDVMILSQAMRFLIPTAYFGLGGWAKAVFPRLYALLHSHYGTVPDPLAFGLFDFDEADAAITLDGRTFSVQPYLTALPRRPFLDTARAVRRKNGKRPAWVDQLRSSVLFDHVRPVEGPGMNQIPQNANLAYRLVWVSHVLPELERKVRRLHPAPHTLEELARGGINVSKRSIIWVVAGGASTTGPAGLIPLLCELKRMKPRETMVCGIVFSPHSYRDKSTEHQTRGQAIYRATLEQLFRIHEGDGFSQIYNADSYQLGIDEEPFDQLFIVDGSLGNGKSDLKTEDLADLVARFLYKFAVGPLGERILGRIADCNPTATTSGGNNQ